MIILIHLLKADKMLQINKKLLVAGAWFLTSQLLVGQGWQANPEIVQKLSKQGSEFNYYEDKVPEYVLPDILSTLNGTEVRTAREWTSVRRGEILELLRENVFGRIPPTKYSKTFKVVNTDRNAMGGAATLKQIDIVINSDGKELKIRLTMFVPNKTRKPVPVFLLIDNRGPANTDPTRQTKSEFWPAEEVISRGYAIAVFYNSDVDPDNFDDFKNGIHGILDRGERQPDSLLITSENR